MSRIKMNSQNDNWLKSWKNLFKFLNVNNKSTIIEFSSDSTKFRLTMNKSYYDDDYFENSSLFISIVNCSFIEFISSKKSLNMSQLNNQFAVLNDQKSKVWDFLEFI